MDSVASERDAVQQKRAVSEAQVEIKEKEKGEMGQQLSRLDKELKAAKASVLGAVEAAAKKVEAAKREAAIRRHRRS